MIHQGIREGLEVEEERLSPYAARCRSSAGRLCPEGPCPMRTAFQRDRDRIVHCKAFRRLKHKTQVFIAPQGDHYVTRLTHTLEVSQIARSISRALRLNEDLTEAIALGHDLGHPPFGHVGEEVLSELYPPGFEHSEQSLRVVDSLERDGQGLNLTHEVREGILHHSKDRSGITAQPADVSGTLEGQVCKLADAVAYINHDTADAIRAGLISEGDLPRLAVSTLGRSTTERINTLITDIVDSSWAARGPVSTSDRPGISLSPPVLEAANCLRDFLFERVYRWSSTLDVAEEAREVVRILYRYFIHHPDEALASLSATLYSERNEPAERRVVDFIAGMTDQYAFRVAAEVSPFKCHLQNRVDSQYMGPLSFTGR
ncbi:MAG: deoxyguanosinetriphosphate triphosphohydrolase [Chloroflexi bacterium]|nr:deoxyguanosinetriphosphate triphosphohydrolase [Chloroflexota bacterium]